MDFFSCSPGRSPSSYDNEIVMMNHVYKERFPKVRQAPHPHPSSHHNFSSLARAPGLCAPPSGQLAWRRLR